MRLLIGAISLLSWAQARFAQNPGQLKPFLMVAECGDVATTASAYLREHGLNTSNDHGSTVLSIQTTGSKPWTDSEGKKVSDFRVYWIFSDKKSDDKLPFGIWHLRLSRYRPRGVIKLASTAEGCSIYFELTFSADGANVLGILPVDSQWDIGSNGRMERDYLDGIKTELEHRKTSRATTADQK